MEEARLLVGKDDRVKEASLMRGFPFGLSWQAIQAADQCRYKPALKDGKPVSYLSVVEIEFKLP